MHCSTHRRRRILQAAQGEAITVGTLRVGEDGEEDEGESLIGIFGAERDGEAKSV